RRTPVEDVLHAEGEVEVIDSRIGTLQVQCVVRRHVTLHQGDRRLRVQVGLLVILGRRYLPGGRRVPEGEGVLPTDDDTAIHTGLRIADIDLAGPGAVEILHVVLVEIRAVAAHQDVPRTDRDLIIQIDVQAADIYLEEIGVGLAYEDD